MENDRERRNFYLVVPSLCFYGKIWLMNGKRRLIHMRCDQNLLHSIRTISIRWPPPSSLFCKWPTFTTPTINQCLSFVRDCLLVNKIYATFWTIVKFHLVNVILFRYCKFCTADLCNTYSCQEVALHSRGAQVALDWQHSAICWEGKVCVDSWQHCRT